ncbi:MAG: SH3 domain-containing protein [Saprospiraceae bacterium]
MSEKSSKRSIWLTIESIAIAIFCIFFITWSMRKCNEESYLRQNTSNKYHLERARDSMAKAARENLLSTDEDKLAETEETKPKETEETPKTEPAKEIKPAKVEKPINTKKAEEKTTPKQFQVIVDGANLREKPALNARSLGKLKLNDYVTFLNETSKEKQKINIGANKVTEQPWYKVKTKKGTVGWVYGAGVKK